MKVRPYRTVANVIDGVVITFQDITDRANVSKRLSRNRRTATVSVFDQAFDAMVLVDPAIGLDCSI